MAIHFQLRDGLVELTFQGKIIAADFQQVLEKLQELEARMEVTPDRITDMSEGDLSALDSRVVTGIAAKRQQAKLKNNVKSAILAPGLEQFGLARMFQTCNQNPAIAIRIFKDSASAYHWLGRPDRVVPEKSA
jgi:hypothetical protein